MQLHMISQIALDVLYTSFCLPWNPNNRKVYIIQHYIQTFVINGTLMIGKGTLYIIIYNIIQNHI